MLFVFASLIIIIIFGDFELSLKLLWTLSSLKTPLILLCIQVWSFSVCLTYLALPHRQPGVELLFVYISCIAHKKWEIYFYLEAIIISMTKHRKLKLDIQVALNAFSWLPEYILELNWSFTSIHFVWK